MRYLLLIYGNEQTAAAKSPEAQAAEMDAWWKYTADLEQSGQHLAALIGVSLVVEARSFIAGPTVVEAPTTFQYKRQWPL